MTRNDIIQAAFRVWGADLYHATSLSKLADSLQISKSALYRYFNNKQALIESMCDCFFEEYNAYIQPYYDKATKNSDKKEKYCIISHANIEYCLRNREKFVFSLMYIYKRIYLNEITSFPQKWFTDIQKFWFLDGTIESYCVMITVISLSVYFHKYIQDYSEDSINMYINCAKQKIMYGIALNEETIDAFNYDHLEHTIITVQHDENKELFHAVATEIANSGLFQASMQDIADRMGLSKSSLYSHYSSKESMIKQFFITEFEQINRCINEGVHATERSDEQLYAALYSVSEYFRSWPELLHAIDGTKTIHIEKPVIFNYDVKTIQFPGIYENIDNQWILFLLVSMLMHQKEVNIRVLFRFICLGLQGFLYKRGV
ncbi:MAG: TetR/AcrR family transcriptional regulator [Treponema sp.]|jgi:AcrR family transcriptional regulator|nr:TetR/AcrR family transcriptional regulator [Treponema sp.]